MSGNCDVVLRATGHSPINVIRTVREVTGLGFKEAKDLVDAAPSTIKRSMRGGEAAAVARRLIDAGASVKIRHRDPRPFRGFRRTSIEP